MKTTHLGGAVLSALIAAAAGQAHASVAAIYFDGSGVSGSLAITYGPATDENYSDAFEVTGISGAFSDSNIGIVNAAVGSLVAVTRDTPESTNHLAPKDFSRFAVASGLPPESHGFLTYDNLFWPGGSPQTASDYPPHGGFLDIYGLMFTIDGGRVVDLWSNGAGADGAVDYGVAVATSAEALDYVGGVSARVPEPASLLLLVGGLLGMMAVRQRAAL